MGVCKYCGKNAGLFSSQHKECYEKHQSSQDAILAGMHSYFRGQLDISSVKKLIEDGQKMCYIKAEDVAEVARITLKDYSETLRPPHSPRILILVDDFIKSLNIVSYNQLNQNGEIDGIAQKIIQGFFVEYFKNIITLPQVTSRVSRVKSVIPLSSEVETKAQLYVLNKAAINYLKDGILTADEEQKVEEFTKQLSVPIGDGAYDSAQYPDIEKLQQSILIRSVQQGIMPTLSFDLPVLLSKNESPLWVYNNVNMFLEKVRRETVGRTGGFSFRICKGVYYRTGQFRGHPVEHRSMELAGTGILIVTTQHLIFYSSTKCEKVPIKKLIGVTPYADGIEIHKEGASKRMTFQGFDSWFIVNILSVIGNI